MTAGGPLTVAVAAGAGGMLGWGLADLFAKKTIDQIGDITTLVWAHVAGTLLVVLGLAIAAATDRISSLPNSGAAWLGLAAFGALQGVVYLLVYRGFGKGQVAVLAPVFASFSGLVALVSVLALREPMSISVVLALVVIFVGIVGINAEPQALRSGRLRLARVPGFPEVAAATLLATIWTLGWGRFIQGRDWIASAAIMYSLMTVALVLYAAASRRRLVVAHRSAWTFLALIGACEVGAYVAVSWGYGATAHTSVVALISGAFSLPTIVLARIFLKERTSRLQAAATVLIIAGIALIYVPAAVG